MSAELLQMEDAVFVYDQEPVLKQVSLSIREGDFIAVVGPNGSGKSTLLKLLGGILKTRSGSVRFRGRDMKELKRKTLARSLAWIPQEHAMAFDFKVSEIVMMGRHPYLSAFSFESSDDLRIVHEAMRLTDTDAFHDRGFNAISGGEKQRVMLASAIAQEPEVMLLDEPTSALDIKYQVQILNILERLNRERSMTVVLAMHDLQMASRYCKKLVLLHAGEVMREGTPEEVLQKDILENAYEVKVKLFRDPDDGRFLVFPQ